MIGSKIKIRENQVIKVSRMKPVIKPTAPHKHIGYHELIFLSRGSGTHSIDSTVFEVMPPIAFYLKPGQVHCWDFSQIPEGFVILFKEEAISMYTKTLGNLFKLPAKFNLLEDSKLFMIVKHLYDEFKAAQKQEVLQAYLNLILLQSFETSNYQPNADQSKVADFYKFKLLVNENFIQSRQVNYYSDLMNISVYRLNDICMAVANTQAANIIKERVLIEIKNQITHTSQSISEIAYSLNFSDPSNFVKFFKSLTTLTPSQYRDRLNNKILI